MKNVKTILGILTLCLTLIIVSCKNTKQKDNSTQTEQVAKNEYTSDYVCPMHCEGSGSDTEGECPKCGMAYVKNEIHMEDGHTHN